MGLTFVRWVPMPEEADQFRDRARQCRALAEDAREAESRRTLIEMAHDLEAEADRLDAGDAKPNDV